MSVAWLLPSALAGLAFVALPIAVHLLARHESRRVPFPSLRFLRRAELSAWRRRSVQDALLLALRILIVAAAAGALASPVFITPGRTEQQQARVVRAVVSGAGAAPALVEAASDGALRASVFETARPGDAVVDALNWLDDQPAARREIVFVSPLRRGDVTEADLVAVPGSTGIRFVIQEAPPVDPRRVSPVLRLRDGRLELVRRAVEWRENATVVSTDGGIEVTPVPIAIVAPEGDRRLAEAALSAALSAGVPWPPSAPERLVLVWPGTADQVVAAAALGGPIVRLPAPASAAAAASMVAVALAAAVDDAGERVEPARVASGDLARWQRPAGPAAPRTPPADEGDRRWLWGGALLLLALESIARRGRAVAPAAVEGGESRVA